MIILCVINDINNNDSNDNNVMINDNENNK